MTHRIWKNSAQGRVIALENRLCQRRFTHPGMGDIGNACMQQLARFTSSAVQLLHRLRKVQPKDWAARAGNAVNHISQRAIFKACTASLGGCIISTKAWNQRTLTTRARHRFLAIHRQDHTGSFKYCAGFLAHL